MDVQLLRAYQQQVLLQCQFVLLASRDPSNALDLREKWWQEKRWQESKPPGVGEVFYAIQNLLNAAANISKILWGVKARFTKERKPIRDSIGVDDDSPLKSMLMRHNFEHLDERINRWWNESQRHNFMDLQVLSTDSVAGFNDRDMFRTFDDVTWEVAFWEDRLNIREIINEVHRIYPQVARAFSPPPLTPPDEPEP